ncbi:MAG: hypothetical protein ABSB15_29100 [Bryobacteraceae bacterium]
MTALLISAQVGFLGGCGCLGAAICMEMALGQPSSMPFLVAAGLLLGAWTSSILTQFLHNVVRSRLGKPARPIQYIRSSVRRRRTSHKR